MRSLAARVLLATLAVVLSSCCGRSMPGCQGGSASLVCERPAAMRTSGWLELRDLSFHADSEQTPPSEPYVRGQWIGGFFDATGDVMGQVGDPPKGRSVTRGYLELRTRSFFRNDGTRSRVPPYVEGARDDDSGSFFPGAAISWSAQ